jgi:Uma2 family endonuclease
MSTAETVLMTAEEFLALPDDGRERWLINGQLREKEDAMTYRNRFHAWVEARIAFLLSLWLGEQPSPRGAVFSGEVGCRLMEDSVVGIDVAFFSHDTVARQSGDTTLIDGTPVLAVEILSPSDRHEEITEKVLAYLDCGVPVVWIVDPYFKTVQVHRPGEAPETYNVRQILPGQAELPGFETPVAELFPEVG